MPAGWDLTSATCNDGSNPASIGLAAGETVTCTFTNTKRGEVRVIKTVSGQPITGSETFLFEIRQGASPASNGTVLASQTASSSNGGNLTFGGIQLVPGIYQLCEFIPQGWNSTIMTMPGAFVPNSASPPIDNAFVCVNFTLDPGETETITIDNTPPPGGMAKTIGFWKNWSSCSGGKQASFLNVTLASFPGGGVLIGDLFVDTCKEAVAILDKSQLTGQKMSSDAAYGLAAQFLAAKLNVQAGAGFCPAELTAINDGQALLDSINFLGTGDYLGSKVKGQLATTRNLALSLANTLDQYNNNLLC